MNEGQNYDYEIDLRELLLVLWKKKLIIVSFSLAGAILAGLLSIFVITPVYNTDLKIDLNIPETYITKYGEYKLPVSTNGQYMNLITSNDVILNTMNDMGYKRGEDMTIKELKEKISMGDIDTKNSSQNVFDVKVSAKSAEESLKFAKTLYNNYFEYVDMLTRDRAVSYYYDSFSAGLKGQEVILESTKKILAENKAVLVKTPETINQSALVAKGNNIVIENIINPAYVKLQEGIVENEQLIISTEDSIRVFKQNLKELDIEKKAIAEYYETGISEEQEGSIVNIAKTNIYLLSSPVAPIAKTSPSNGLNAVIGLVIGGMLAVVLVLVKEYWLKKGQNI
ncbi:LPS O-antigen subunit length determinant protein (WzzB/FepE family) [Ruminiclostridium sufflavum DSM 19573]|uniref:LPS O-antigen subunit length determinant protein (WzzB/FepE family) n=1 Tax=Ruminiclostridium sufflavum DSM 19573 TaxID=1121337 RepID=A0A318XJJ8_9FIRM|nr:Wzz/FepE/Etk N-terminal domain-containing protein [Ruminiclostridium sufflavum]PYG87174.1 LPS O-antigen subunit length determinant protein (WzzB/FepE family) [Ruminiclostridium sufflavum DSM 19573]